MLLVFGDALVTALWVMISSLFGEAAETLSEISGLGEFALAVAVTVACIAALGPLCAMFGGAQFNPIHPAAFAVAGKGSLKVGERERRCVCHACRGSSGARHAVPCDIGLSPPFAQLPA